MSKYVFNLSLTCCWPDNQKVENRLNAIDIRAAASLLGVGLECVLVKGTSISAIIPRHYILLYTGNVQYKINYHRKSSCGVEGHI